MKRLLSLGLALLCFFASPMVHASWNADWTKRAKISLNTSADGIALQTGADAVPLLVRLHTGNFQFIDARPDGADLRFIAADDKTPLKFHIEKFDGLNELALIWVELPKLAPASKSDFIWLYYGNANAAPASDPKGSYDPAQALVYHFGEKEALPQDSTANANHATASTAKPTSAGLIGGDLSFDGSATLALPASASLKSGAGGLTLSFWIKPAELGDAQFFADEAATGLRLGLVGGKLVAQAGGVTLNSTAALTVGTWQHVAVVAKDGLTIYLNGVAAGTAAGTVPELSGASLVGKGFKGELDELEIASTARTADWIRAAALSQGPEQKLLNVSPAEGGDESGGPSTLRILLGAVTIDGWVVIGILLVMFAISVAVMVSKAMFVGSVARDNDRFKGQVGSLIDGIQAGSGNSQEAEGSTLARFRNAPLYRLYAAGAQELRNRLEAYAKAGRRPVLTDAAINAIRASVDARLVRETQRLNSRMVLLTIAIAGGPFLGLLGTVVGVMITFAAIAAAGDVNVNAIAPGIAAALVATVAGLAVAIPALFGYNYLGSRISELESDMQVFVDEFITRIAENHAE
jgi:biopolymer transport protein ExbB